MLLQAEKGRAPGLVNWEMEVGHLRFMASHFKTAAIKYHHVRGI
jgi:hypothetical protein